jgi:AcrR family transcriptional regulator
VNAPDPAARERVLDTAAALFYEHGFHAVGVDLIVAQAAVAKTTLYRHFPSKDELIVAYLERANLEFWAWFDASVDPVTPARDQLLAVFDAIETLATSAACLGCAFQVSAAEFPDRAHPGHATALAHKEAVRTRLRELAAAAGAAHPDALGDALLLVMDGAFAAARMYGPTSPAARAAGAARTLIDAHLPARRPRPRQKPAAGT